MSKVKFWRFCMMKPWSGNVDSFCSKFKQSDLKGLEDTCEHNCHAKYGSESRSGHERSSKSKVLFRACGTWFTFAHRNQKSTPFCNLSPCKKGQVNRGSHKVKFLNLYFQIKNVRFWTSLISGFHKCHFHFCARSRSAQNCSFKI